MFSFFKRSIPQNKTNIKIKMSDVYKSFGKKHVLQGVDLEVKKGESLVIIGGSGTGKSVTLKCILGLLSPDKGNIEVDGQDILKMTSSQREKNRFKNRNVVSRCCSV